MQQKDKSIIFAFALLILGIVIAVQFRSTVEANKQKSTDALKIERLMPWINEEIEAGSVLRAQIEENILKREQYMKAYFEEEKDYSLKAQWEDVSLKSGFNNVRGPGVIIELDDADARQGGDPQFLIIHDQDIRIILNDLKKAGAQAISIKGERVVPTSEIVCAGPTILINGNRYAVPYEIRAIGDPDLLYDSLMRSERVALMIEDKIRVEIKKSKDIFIPRFSNVDNIDKYISGLEAVKQ